MDSLEASSFISRLTDGFDKRLSPERRALYVDKLAAWDYEVGRRAVNNLIDTEERFPAVMKLLARCQFFAGQQSARPVVEQEVPMTPQELSEAAELMAAEAALRRERHNGREDVYTRLLESGADVYAHNAHARATGQREMALPKIRSLLRELEGRLVVSDAQEDA